MSVIQYLKYNNYANRIVKVESSYADYVSASSGNMIQLEANFNPGDGLWTKHVCGKYQDASNPTEQTFDFDYLVVYSDDTYYNIVSRWFIIKPTRLRGGQWELTLKRDVIADKYDDTIKAPAIIERAKIEADNPLIFNPENFTYNEIKKGEILLKDKTQIPWIVAYIASNTGDVSASLELSLNNRDDVVSVDFASNNFPYVSGNRYSIADDYIYKFYWAIHDSGTTNYVRYETKIESAEESPRPFVLQVNELTAVQALPHNIVLFSPSTVTASGESNKLCNTLISGNIVSINESISTLAGWISNSEWNLLQTWKNKIIKTTDGKYYRCELKSMQGAEDTVALKSGDTPFTTIQGLISSNPSLFTVSNTMNNKSCEVDLSGISFVIQFTEITSVTGTCAIKNSRNHTENSLFDIVAIPCGDLSIGEVTGGTYTESCRQTREIALGAANALAKALSTSLYDIQLLPYCPIQGMIQSHNEETCIVIESTGENKVFSYIVDSDTEPVGALFYVTQAHSTFDINQSIELERTEVIDWSEDSNFTPTGYSELVKNTDLLFYRPVTTMTSSKYVYIRNKYNEETIKVKILNRHNEVLNSFSCYRMALGGSNNVESGSNYYTRIIFNSSDGTRGIDNSTFDYDNIFIVVNIGDDVVSGGNLGSVSVNNRMFREGLYYPIYKLGDEALDIKVENETSRYRLCSPNYQGSFDFNVAKNGGVSYFNVDMTLKPYQPYIHVNPNFKKMYGADYDDARGLICNGDFSYGMIQDAFRTYELQNKNYEAIFNRNIQSMDIEHKIQKQEALFAVTAGAVGGAMSGATAGAMAGGPLGAVAGAALGGAASTAGGILDYQNLLKRQEDAKDRAIDLFKYQLGNVQALPYSLTRCPAFTYNNKIFPFVEYYDCTDEEKKALKDFLKYRSYTVGVIGTIKEYQKTERTFIKGQIIRIDSLTAPANVALEIIEEINKGVYI